MWMEKFQAAFSDFLDQASDWLARHWNVIAVPMVVAFLSALLIQSPFHQSIPEYRVGEISAEDFKAPSSFELIDEELTFERQRQAEQRVLDIYDFDSRKTQDKLLRIESAFQNARQALLRGTPLSQSEFENKLGLSVKTADFDRLNRYEFSKPIESAFKVMAQNFTNGWLLTEKPEAKPDDARVVVVDILTAIEEPLPWRDFIARVRTIDDVRGTIANAEAADHSSFRALSVPQLSLVKSLAQSIADPTVSFNQIQTNIKRAQAREASDPVVVSIEKGEMLVREGERIERRHKLFFDHLRRLQDTRADFQSLLGLTLLLVTLMFLLYWVGDRNFKKFKVSSRDRWVLGACFVISLAIITGLHLLFEAFHGQEGSRYQLTILLPFAFVGMTLRLFTSMEIASFFAILFGFCIAWLLKNPYIGLIATLTAFAGAAAMRHITQRMDVIRSGIIAGGIQGLLVALGVALGLNQGIGFENLWLDLGACLIFGMFSGLFAAALTLVAQPLIEFIGYTTDLRLMELSNTNHPLLKEMIMKAPGTYYHSFVVSQLSEKAAEAINANPLFARVASLYHDVGKTRKAEYFIENIQGENKHDKLVPSMSALIISNHVKEGIELGQQYQLPQAIIDVIPQHHGTALISYFFDKAKKLAADDEEVKEQDFRYPGPKPQTKEAAIIMMADAVEATAKSMAHATTDTLRQQVNATIRRFFLDGQLDECELSLKDLNAIGNAFVNVLQGIYHQRIEYPHLKNQSESKSKTDDPTRSISSSKKAG